MGHLNFITEFTILGKILLFYEVREYDFAHGEISKTTFHHHFRPNMLTKHSPLNPLSKGQFMLFYLIKSLEILPLPTAKYKYISSSITPNHGNLLLCVFPAIHQKWFCFMFRTIFGAKQVNSGKNREKHISK
jgi:hypothetical protein